MLRRFLRCERPGPRGEHAMASAWGAKWYTTPELHAAIEAEVTERVNAAVAEAIEDTTACVRNNLKSTLEAEVQHRLALVLQNLGHECAPLDVLQGFTDGCRAMCKVPSKLDLPMRMRRTHRRFSLLAEDSRRHGKHKNAEMEASIASVLRQQLRASGEPV